MPDPTAPDPTLLPGIAERLRTLLESATPGPWGWRGNDDGLVELRGHGPFGAYDGRVISTLRAEPCIVELDDESVALTSGACDACRDVFRRVSATGNGDLYIDHRCAKPENLATVWLNGEHAIEPSNTWARRERHYRSDVADVDHPDAQLIAAARNALPTLLEVEAAAREVATTLAHRQAVARSVMPGHRGAHLNALRAAQKAETDALRVLRIALGLEPPPTQPDPGQEAPDA